MKYSGITVIVAMSISLFLPSGEAANSCFSTLTSDMKIHAPSVKFEDTFYQADFEVRVQGPTGEGGVWLRLLTLTAGSLLDCSNPSIFFFDGVRYTLRIPMLEFNSDDYWADLEWIPTSDGQLWLRLLAVGSMSNQVFITSVTGDGNLGSWPDAGGKIGLEAGDAICQARAAAAGLKGTFVAWLSDENDDAYCRVHGLAGKKADNCGQSVLPTDAGPWVRTDGFPFSGTIGELLDQSKVFVPVAMDEFGKPFNEPRWYRTGTRPDGTLADQSGGPCGNWTSGADTVVTGSMSEFFDWTSGSFGNCGDSVRGILCFQVAAGPALPNFVLPGKKAFLTSVTGNGNLGSWSVAHGQSGIAAGDEICRSLAADAGLQNAQNFKAWLSDADTDALARFTSNGPWVRLDGVVLAENREDLTDGSLNTFLTLTEAGDYTGLDFAWTGTNRNGGKKADTCNSWLDGTPSLKGGVGRIYDRSTWTGAGQIPCNLSYMRLYCLED